MSNITPHFNKILLIFILVHFSKLSGNKNTTNIFQLRVLHGDARSEECDTYSTVRVALMRKTPCRAHCKRQPLLGILKPGISSASSLYIFFKDGGTLTPGGTEKDSP